MKRWLAIFLAALCALSMAWADPVSVVDDDGHRLTLAAPARRIVSIAPHLTELLFAAGAGERVVAVSAWSDHPAAAKSLPRIGDAAMLDLERIVALQPDLVIVWKDGSSAQQLQRLAVAGLPIYASDARSLAHIGVTLRRLGHLAGTDAVAEARASEFEARLAALRAGYAQRRPLAAFYQIWQQPLMTVNGRHVISEALQVCGARNVFGDLKLATPTVDVEAVLLARPDVIVTGRAGSDGPDPLARWRSLKSLHAALVTVDPDTLNRASDRIVQGIEELCVKLDRLR
ncbi:MAG: cobalamin-binding protein [Rubrivivax sp.]|nr:cobalamin-binding protein [Rubrivivax sp.]MDH5338294.1 cobalamin-binding protein [Rubrivivax sp.]